MVENREETMRIQREWEKEHDKRSSFYVGEADLNYWEARAKDFSQMRASRNWEFGRRILETLENELPPESTVLDVGAGPGSLLIPFSASSRIRNVTAVEPALSMISELKKNATQSGIFNFQILACPWEKVNTDGLASCFDLAIISITLWIFRDMKKQIRRLEKCSRSFCCVVASIDDNVDKSGDSLWEKILGDTPRPNYSEFPFIFNLLYNMGRRPEVRFIDHQAERSTAIRIRQQKLFYAKYTQITPDIEHIIEKDIQNRARNGVVLEDYTSAAIWWKRPDPMRWVKTRPQKEAAYAPKTYNL
jgi:hypothetical protein